MIKMKGNFAEAIIYYDSLDTGSEGLIKALCNSIIAENSKIRVMPDVHPGKGCAVGMTMTLENSAHIVCVCYFYIKPLGLLLSLNKMCND